MRFLILAENSNGSWPHLFYRSMGAYELRKRIEQKGHQAEIIEWFSFWNNTDLKSVTTNYFKNGNDGVLAISTPFESQDLQKIAPYLLWLKQTYPNVTIIHGGSRTYLEQYSNLIDVFFLGRSMEMFDDWLDKKDLSKYIAIENPLVLINKNFNENIDKPVVPILKDSDCLSSKDILGFEIGVGCRFNCSFCNYELRKSKITNLLDPKELHNYFDIAYNKYNVSNFFASDDTINESDDKLEIIAEAISTLNYRPNITCFARIDMLSSRPTQIKLLEKIKFKSLFFGIETFNSEASKLVRKKSGIFDNYETLKKIKSISPETFTVGGLIIGLYKDSKESIENSIKRVVDEKLLNSLQIYPLNITKATSFFEPTFHSDIELNPEEHGYKLDLMRGLHHGNKNVISLNWRTDWIDYDGATNLSEQLLHDVHGKINLINHLEYSCYVALGIVNNSPLLNHTSLKNVSYSVSEQLKNQYILNRKKLLLA